MGSILDDVVNALFPTKPRTMADEAYEYMKARQDIDGKAISDKQQAEAEKQRLIEESKPPQYPVWGMGAPGTDKYVRDSYSGQMIVDRRGMSPADYERANAEINQRLDAERQARLRLAGNPRDPKTGKPFEDIVNSADYIRR